jgi:hypothetical protein
MTPEAKARQLIDQKLEQAGWNVQDTKQLNLAANLGVAVREYPTDSGPADYVLFEGGAGQKIRRKLHASFGEASLERAEAFVPWDCLKPGLSRRS